MELTNVRSIFLRGCGVDWSILRALGQPFSFLKEKRKALAEKKRTADLSVGIAICHRQIAFSFS